MKCINCAIVMEEDSGPILFHLWGHRSQYSPSASARSQKTGCADTQQLPLALLPSEWTQLVWRWIHGSVWHPPGCLALCGCLSERFGLCFEQQVDKRSRLFACLFVFLWTFTSSLQSFTGSDLGCFFPLVSNLSKVGNRTSRSQSC